MTSALNYIHTKECKQKMTIIETSVQNLDSNDNIVPMLVHNPCKKGGYSFGPLCSQAEDCI